MDRVRARRLTSGERRRLRQMKRQLSNHVNSRHARIIRLSAGGVSNREIARLCDCTPQWVRRIIHRFNAQGLAGITWYPFYADHTAQPRKFFAKVVEQIVGNRRQWAAAVSYRPRTRGLAAQASTATVRSVFRSKCAGSTGPAGGLVRALVLHSRQRVEPENGRMAKREPRACGTNTVTSRCFLR